MEVFREHNKRCRALIGIDFTASTVQRYESLMRITGEFLLKEYGSEDLYLDELPVHLVEDYEFYMKTERRCVHNTVMKNLKNFKKIIRIVGSEGPVSRQTYPHGAGRPTFFGETGVFVDAPQGDLDPSIGAGP